MDGVHEIHAEWVCMLGNSLWSFRIPSFLEKETG